MARRTEEAFPVDAARNGGMWPYPVRLHSGATGEHTRPTMDHHEEEDIWATEEAPLDLRVANNPLPARRTSPVPEEVPLVTAASERHQDQEDQA